MRNSNTATALLDGPSHNSAVRGVTRKSPAFGSSGPSHHILSVARQIEAAISRSRIVSAEAVIERYAFSVLSTKTRPISWSTPISCSLVLRKSVTNHISLEDRSGRASSGRARNPLAPRLVSMHTPTRSIVVQTRSRLSFPAMKQKREMLTLSSHARNMPRSFGRVHQLFAGCTVVIVDRKPA
jgi:hypothetical protein